MWIPTINSCDQYLDDRTGKYEFRAIRYRKAIDWMILNGLDDSMTVVDVGAGMTELDYTLRKEYDWMGRYIPVDGGIDGVDINTWTPSREAHFFVALEILEHLNQASMVLEKLKAYCTIGVVTSTPDPRTTDVLGMDATHVKELYPEFFESAGLNVQSETFYGGVFSGGKPDSLFATYLKE